MSDWWSKNMGGSQPTRSTSVPPATTAPPVRYVPEGNVTSTPVTYDPNQDNFVSKAQTSRMNDRCPACFSGNYFPPQGTTRYRCYDCGYPLVQAGSGGGLPSDSSGPSTPARQVSTGNNFNPNTIVGRIE